MAVLREAFRPDARSKHTNSSLGRRFKAAVKAEISSLEAVARFGSIMSVWGMRSNGETG